MQPVPAIEITEEVMFYDTDCGGVVHNTAYLRFVEKARTKLAAVMGMELREMAATQIFPVVLRTEIDYKRPAVLGDSLIVRGSLDILTKARFWVKFEICRLGGSEVLVSCRQALALVQMPGGKVRRLPDSWQTQWPQVVEP